MVTYLGTEVEPDEHHEPEVTQERYCPTPGDANWVWCRWPDGRWWKHWRKQLVRPEG